MTSATERIRAMLDERRVKYDTDDEDGCEFTEWVANGLEWEADSRGELVSLMPVMLITPEQAIAATLGSCNCSDNCTDGERTWTCHVESSIIDTYEYNRWEYELSCGHTIIWEDSEPPRYCPECGARCVG